MKKNKSKNENSSVAHNASSAKAEAKRFTLNEVVEYMETVARDVNDNVYRACYNPDDYEEYFEVDSVAEMLDFDLTCDESAHVVSYFLAKKIDLHGIPKAMIGYLRKILKKKFRLSCSAKRVDRHMSMVRFLSFFPAGFLANNNDSKSILGEMAGCGYGYVLSPSHPLISAKCFLQDFYLNRRFIEEILNRFHRGYDKRWDEWWNDVHWGGEWDGLWNGSGRSIFPDNALKTAISSWLASSSIRDDCGKTMDFPDEERFVSDIYNIVVDMIQLEPAFHRLADFCGPCGSTEDPNDTESMKTPKERHHHTQREHNVEQKSPETASK